MCLPPLFDDLINLPHNIRYSDYMFKKRNDTVVAVNRHLRLALKLNFLNSHHEFLCLSTASGRDSFPGSPLHV
jgi:hypothetical protein